MSHVINNAIHTMTTAAMWAITAVLATRVALSVPVEALWLAIATVMLTASLTWTGSRH